MDAYLNLILLLVSVFLMTTGINCSDPCGRAREIYDPFRSTIYKLKKGEKALCDRKLHQGWYKFKGGLEIPTTKPAPMHCGTFAPIWIKGNLPKTIGETVDTAKACVNLFNIRDGCSSTLPISVRLCEGNFYVYYLTPPRGCAMAYCAGDGKPCPRGKEGTFPNCHVSNKVDFPESLVPLPTITYGGVSVLGMVCTFDFPAWNNVSYSVEWYANSFTSSDSVLIDSWCKNNKDSTCTRRQSSITVGKHFAVGDTVSCKLKMKYFTSSKNIWTEFGKDSKQYYVGIEVSPRHILVKECKGDRSERVTLKPTVPFLPSRPGFDTVTVSILIPEKFKEQKKQAAVDKCSVDLRTQDMTKGQSITIRGICDNINEDQQSYLFHFSPVTSNPYWNSAAYRMPSVKVTVDNTKIKSCRSTSDPYLHSFGGTSFTYNEAGDFLMYRNIVQKIEVHVRTWTCAKYSATCVCGVAIREGKDIIELSICKQVFHNEDANPTKLFVRKKSPGRLAHGIHVIKKMKGQALEHEVILSSGTRVKVYRYKITLDVHVFVPNTDGVRSDGLCGKIDGDTKDIFKYGRNEQPYTNQVDFSRSWLPPAAVHACWLLEFNSFIFCGVCPNSKWPTKTVNSSITISSLKAEESYLEENLPKDDRTPEQVRSCFCDKEENGKKTKYNNCQESSNRFKNVEKDGREEQLHIDPNIFSRRSVDSHLYTDDIIDQEYRSFIVADNDVQNALKRIRSKRSAAYTRWPEQRAKQYCTKLIKNSEAEKTCRRLDWESVKSAIGQCTNDLVLSGNENFAILAFDTMKAVCEETALTNLSLYTQDSNGELIFSKETVQDLCPADCSWHGKCKNRTCICDEGFTAADCSIDVNAVPELLGIYNGGHCDVRERPCKKTDLLGHNLINSYNLTCHVKEVKVYPGPWSPRGVPFTTHGKMIDIFGVKCDLPEPPTRLGDYDHEGTPAGGLLISVSNDGFNASVQKLRQVSYDSKCMNCSNSSNCELKPNSCLIRGHCFAANEPNPRDWCQQCLPKDDQNSWTRRKNNQAPKFTTKTTMFAVQGEDLVIQLKAADPDNRPVTYSLVNSTATGHTLSSSGLLRGKVISNETFTFKVTDECGAFDTTEMRVRIVQCPCLNGGQCVPHPYHPRGSGLYQCKCKKKFSGEYCEICKGTGNNKPPKFTSETNMFALQGEDLSIQLKAEDPEKMNITYSLLSSTATGHTLNSSGLLRWNVTSNSSFTIKVTDECDTSDTIKMTLRIVQCPCLNGGKCVPHPNHPRGSGKYKCKCKENFSGEHCEMCKGIRNNKHPKFTSDTNIFALQGEDLSIQLKAEDPEKMNITYSLLSSTATGHTLSSSGLLRWNVTSNSSFTIKVTDECDTSDTIEMTLRIVQCPCLYGGICVPHPSHPRGSGKYKCKCKEQFSGEHCEMCKDDKPPNITSETMISARPGDRRSHVCSRGTYETVYTSYRTYRTKYQDYYSKCGWMGWSRCKRTRSWRSYYYASRTKSVYRTYYICNKPPKFTSETNIFALQGEDLSIQLKAEDPEKMNITYSLLSSTATGHTLNSSGLLRWNVTSNSSFTINVTDECDTSDTIEMTLRIVQCPCLNGGKCVPHPNHPRGSGKYKCKCKEKFSGGEHCELCKGIRNNKPPKFTSETNMFALQGEDLSIQLKAEDPEKMNITYSLLSSTATGHTLNSSGLLRWNVTSNSSFTIKVTDECDTSDTIKMTLRIVQCPCLNGGKCVPHSNHPRGSGKYKCKCVNRFRGERCERCPGFVCPPRNVTVKAIGSTKLEVNWLGPSDNLLTYYFVKYAQPPYRFRSEQVPKTTTTKTLNNLKKFTDYRIAVSVVNRYGEKMVETMIKTGEDVPDAAPVITDVSPERYDTILTRWSPIPKDKRNGIIVGYKIYYRQQYTDDAWNSTTTSTGDLTSTTVSGLKSYTDYCVKMSAFTSKGEYPDWDRKQCYPVKTPSLPVKVFSEAISWSEIRLRFEKPKRSRPSNKVQVDYGKEKGRLRRKTACYGSSCVIDNLEPNTLYYFKVIGYQYQKGETPSFTQIRTLSRG